MSRRRNRAAGAVLALAVSACSPLVVMTWDGTGTQQLELDEAEVRCARAEACACYAVGAFHAQRGEPKAARTPLDRACTLGCVPGCVDLAEAYYEGHGGEPRNAALGTRYAIRACKIDPAHCALAGERFELGREVPRDVKRAATFYREGCRRGAADSCGALERVAPPPRRAARAAVGAAPAEVDAGIVSSDPAAAGADAAAIAPDAGGVATP